MVVHNSLPGSMHRRAETTMNATWHEVWHMQAIVGSPAFFVLGTCSVVAWSADAQANRQ